MYSFVIPVHNEAESLTALHRELDDVALENGYEIEIIIIDDGSTDSSWQVIQDLATKDPRVRGIRLRRNFGKAAGLMAGFESARGEIVFTLDGDLQDDPHEIPRLLAKLEEGFDLVSGYKQIRHDPWHKVFPSRVFNWMVSRLTGVKLHDHNCGFKCYRRSVVRELRLYGELHRFVPVLSDAKGYRVGELIVHHRERKFGQSKYGLSRLLKGFLDLLSVKFVTGYAERPQHALGAFGLLFVALGSLGLGFLGAGWIVTRLIPGLEDIHVKDHLAITLFSLGGLLFGGQLMSIGFLGELVTSFHNRTQQNFSISERTDADPTKSVDPTTSTSP